MPVVDVAVRQEHIDEGDRGASAYCAVALAINDVLAPGYHVHASAYEVAVEPDEAVDVSEDGEEDHESCYVAPHSAFFVVRDEALSAFVNQYDDTGSVEPTTFAMYFPDWVLP